MLHRYLSSPHISGYGLERSVLENMHCAMQVTKNLPLYKSRNTLEVPQNHYLHRLEEFSI